VIRRIILVLTLALPLGLRAGNQTANVPADKADRSAAALPATADPNYVIGALDVLSINVWKETELSVVVPVRPDGRISLPLLNDVEAAGVTPMALTASLTEKLKKYFSDPRVAVTVKEINSKRVYILGQVARPGAYSLTPQMTVLQALSTAGGFGQYAGLKSIYVLRMQSGTQVKLPFNYKDVVKGKNTDQNVLLKPEDTIVVP